MDKETLSNYGWIVICVMVLAVMIALATPFGGFIRDAVWSTTNGLFDVNENALNAAGIIMGETEQGTQSGPYIFVNDVAPIQHNMTVNLSSDTITDFSSVSVTRYGSNLLDISKLLGNNLVDNGDGTYTFTRIGEDREYCYSNYQDIFIPKETPISASVNPIDMALTQGNFYIVYVFEDDTTQLKPLLVQDPWRPNTEILVFDKNVIQVGVMCTTTYNEVGDYIVFNEPKINIGGYYEYQNYIAPQTVNANADGSVSVASLSPNVTIITNNSDVDIACEYQKKK